MATPQQPLPEGRPAARPAKGDEADLFAGYHHRLVGRLTGHLGGKRELAEEAAGFAWLQLLRYQPDRGFVEAWLFTVAKHEAYALQRRHRRDHDQPFEPESEAGPVDRDPLELLTQRELLALIERLSPAQRVALGLFARGYRYREICALTGKTYTWVNRHITEGRARIRQLAAEAERPADGRGGQT